VNLTPLTLNLDPLNPLLQVAVRRGVKAAKLLGANFGPVISE
jgi:hypothetical protein